MAEEADKVLRWLRMSGFAETAKVFEVEHAAWKSRDIERRLLSNADQVKPRSEAMDKLAKRLELPDRASLSNYAFSSQQVLCGP